MTWAELKIPEAPGTGNVDFDTWMSQTVKYLRDYLGSFHDRGDPSAFDFTEAGAPLSGNMDAGWHDMDLSAIVPDGAKAVVLRVDLNDDGAASSLRFRKNGNSNNPNQGRMTTSVTGVPITADIIVACDSDRVIEFYASEPLVSVDIVVKGWFK
jgi:hypothetical protein